MHARDPRASRASAPSRRDLLRSTAAFAAAAAIPASLASGASPLLTPVMAPLAGARKTKRVLLVVFGGGVRTRETLESDNTPNLRRMADEGVVFPNTSVRNNGHYGSAVNIFTGTWESFGIRENARTPYPTLFEYVRRDASLGSTDVWLSTSGSDQETNYAYGTDPDYGARFGANLIGGEGIFNAEFKQIMAGDGGRMRRGDDAQEEALTSLRRAVRTPREVRGEGGLNDPAAVERIESYILEELRVARNLRALFKPRLLAVTLRNPDVAHGSFNDYVTVIRRNDEELGLMMDAIRADPELADSTAVFVLPEFGRDRDLNARRGLDHGDSSDELMEVATVAWGPDFPSGKVLTRDVRSIDVTTTIATLFGVKARVARGSNLPFLT